MRSDMAALWLACRRVGAPRCASCCAVAAAVGQPARLCAPAAHGAVDVPVTAVVTCSTISRTEFRRALDEAEDMGKSLSIDKDGEDMDRYFAAMDTSGDGEVGLKEFLAVRTRFTQHGPQWREPAAPMLPTWRRAHAACHQRSLPRDLLA